MPAASGWFSLCPSGARGALGASGPSVHLSSLRGREPVRATIPRWEGRESRRGPWPLSLLEREGRLASPRAKVSVPVPQKCRMDRLLTPRESAKFIAENSRDVFIDDGGVRRVAELLLAKATGPELRIGGWKAIHELNPRGTDEAAVNWVFVTDTLNFSFWSESDEHKCLVGFGGKTYSGYWSLCAAINRALDEGWYPYSRSDPVALRFHFTGRVPQSGLGHGIMY